MFSLFISLFISAKPFISQERSLHMALYPELHGEHVPSFNEALRAVQAGKVLIESLGQRHLTCGITKSFL